MKKLIPALLAVAVFASCRKDSPVLPENGTEVITDTTTLKSFNINYEIPSQVVTTSLSGNTLNLVYAEKVNLLVDPVQYERSWSLRLQQDFSASSLKGFDYYTVASDGTKINNWADENLNNNPKIILGKVDTTINNKKYVKVKVAREFYFSKQYDNAETAASVQSSLIGKRETVNFSSFYYTDDKTIPAVVTAAGIIYQ